MVNTKECTLYAQDVWWKRKAAYLSVLGCLASKTSLSFPAAAGLKSLFQLFFEFFRDFILATSVSKKPGRSAV